MKKWLILSISLFLFGCSTYATRGEQQYLKSKNGETVRVPAPLSAKELNHFYDLAAQEGTAEISIDPKDFKKTA